MKRKFGRSIWLAVVMLSMIAASGGTPPPPPSDGPPPIPSSFYGMITGARAGAIVSVTLAGIKSPVQISRAFWYGGSTNGVVYTIDVPGKVGGRLVDEGTLITFKVNGVKAATAEFHSGMHVNLDLTIPCVGRFC
jgi:hypothetical protein